MARFAGLMLLSLSLVLTSAAFAQTYPTRPIKFLVGYPAGGAMDGISRLVGQKLSERVGQPVLTENRPGASGTIAADVSAKSAPDGYTFFLADTGLLIAPSIMSSVPADVMNGFAPVASISAMTLVFVASNELPVRNTQELIALLKANPGKYSYGSIGLGTVHHFAFEQFKKTLGLDVVHIPYKGASPMVPDMVTGRIPIGVLSLPVVVPLAKAGKVRPIAVTTAQRTASVADWPTVAETIPGFVASPRIFLLAPAGTSSAVISRLNGEINQVLAMSDIQDKFAAQGATPTPMSPEALKREIDVETRRWTAIAKEAAIKAE